MGSPHRIRLRSFHNAQRVKVVDAVKNPAGLREETVTLNALGAVSRIRSDGGAWIRLDERSKVSSVHPFPESDSRSNNVLAYPEDCEAPTKTRADGNRKARRSNKKEVDKAATDEAVPPPTIASFGKDHWSTFAYIETRCVNHRGVPAREHLRCIHGRHPLQAHEGGDASECPTRLKGEVLLHNHDDWDCLDDLEREGLLANIGSTVNPQFKLSPIGHEISKQLRAHIANDGPLAAFEPTLPASTQTETQATA